MHAFIVLSALIAGVVGGYAGSPTDPNTETGVGGNAYGYGFSGTNQGNIPNVPNFPTFDFNNFLTSYQEALKKFQEEFQNNANTYAYTTLNANGNVQAQSSLVFDNARNPGYQNQPSFPGGVPFYGAGGGNFGAGGGNYGAGRGNSGAGSGAFGGDPHSGGAFASGSIGPGGGFQGAAVYPENPETPNIFNRFGGGGEAQPGGDGKFYGVSVSSRSSNINGQKSEEAETTINDNGKVTSYKVKNP